MIAQPGQVIIMLRDDDGTDREYLVLDVFNKGDDTRYALMNVNTRQYFAHHRFTRVHPVREPSEDEAKLFAEWHLTQ